MHDPLPDSTFVTQSPVAGYVEHADDPPAGPSAHSRRSLQPESLVDERTPGGIRTRITAQRAEVYVSITTVETAALRCQRSGVSIEVSSNSPRCAKSTASETPGGGGSAAGGTSSGA